MIHQAHHKLAGYLFTEQAATKQSNQPPSNQPSSVAQAIESGQFTTSDGKPVVIGSYAALRAHIQPIRGGVFTLNLHAAGVDLSEWHMHVHTDSDNESFRKYLPYCAKQKSTNPLFPKVLWAGVPSWSSNAIAFIEQLKQYNMSKLIDRAADASYQPSLGYGIADPDDPGACITTLVDAALRTILTHAAQSDTSAEAKLRQSFKTLVKKLGVDKRQFVEFLSVLKGLGAGISSDVIISDETVTWRDNGELVMLTPIGEFPWEPNHWY